MPAALSLALKLRESPKPVLHIIAEFEKRRWRAYERERPHEPRRSHDKVRPSPPPCGAAPPPQQAGA